MFYTNTKRTCIAVLLMLLISAAGALTESAAQTKKKPRIKYYTVAANQVMRVRLNDELNSEKARIGDTFTSTLVDPVYSKSGLLLAPQGSTVGRARYQRSARAEEWQAGSDRRAVHVVAVAERIPSSAQRIVDRSREFDRHE
jgi:hypothetical protein